MYITANFQHLALSLDFNLRVSQAMPTQMLCSNVWIFTGKSTICEAFLSSLFCLNLLQVMIDPSPCNVKKRCMLSCMVRWPNRDKTIHNSHPSSDGGDWFQAMVFMILAIHLWSSEDLFYFISFMGWLRPACFHPYEPPSSSLKPYLIIML